MTNERSVVGAELRLDPNDAAERRTLKRVLAINAIQVLVAGGVGLAAQSTGLLGAALDNMGDAAVYVVSLYAVGRTPLAQSRAAQLSGVLLIVLAVALLGEVIRRFVGGSEPIGLAMIVTAAVNAATNSVNLRLLRPHRERGVHEKATWIFTSNDMIVNLSTALSGIAVLLLHSRLPDLLIGLVVAGIVIRGGCQILREAREARDAARAPGGGK